jgi:hypothetical protein
MDSGNGKSLGEQLHPDLRDGARKEWTWISYPKRSKMSSIIRLAKKRKDIKLRSSFIR